MEKIIQYYQISFYVPESHLSDVKNALFAAGAGVQGDYDMTCWQCKGTGQFRPLEGANPTIGQVETLEHVTEYKVEMICDERKIKTAIQALKKAHPYEEPAYHVIKLENHY